MQLCVLLFVFIRYCRLGELFNGCNGKVCFCSHLTNCEVYIVMFSIAETLVWVYFACCCFLCHCTVSHWLVHYNNTFYTASIFSTSFFLYHYYFFFFLGFGSD